MARRAGKAASRKARQRNVPRAAPRQIPTPTPVPPVDTPEAGEVTSIDPPRRVTAAAAPVTTSAGSTLSLRERAEYHYVERDLRNIGILTALMAVLLFVAWLAFSTLGLVG